MFTLFKPGRRRLAALVAAAVAGLTLASGVSQAARPRTGPPSRAARCT
ncbi:hypothetical protein [Kribbella sp. NPDC003557]